LRAGLRRRIEREKLVGAGITTPYMVHAQVILIKGGEAAKQKLEEVLALYDHSARYDVLAKRYSQYPSNGDLGIVYDGIPNVDPGMKMWALQLPVGHTTAIPVETEGGWFILKVLSNSDYHPANENDSYAAAVEACRERQVDIKAAELVDDLMSKAKVVYYVP